jgi:transcriptional regulator with XRE-family HTH domain
MADEHVKAGTGRRHDNASKARAVHARAERMKRVSQLNLDGWTQQEIAEELGLNRSVISRDLSRLRAEWAVEHKALHNEHVERELVVLARDEKDVRRRLAKLEGSRENHKHAKGWHEVLLKIHERRAKLLGLDAPTKIEQKTDATITDRRSTLERLGPEAQRLATELSTAIYAPRLAVVAAIEATNGVGHHGVNGTNGVAH